MEQEYKNHLSKNKTIKEKLIEILSDYNFELQGRKINYVPEIEEIERTDKKLDPILHIKDTDIYIGQWSKDNHETPDYSVLHDVEKYGTFSYPYIDANEQKAEFGNYVKILLNTALINYGKNIYEKIEEDCSREKDSDFYLKDADKNIIEKYTDKDLFFANVYENYLVNTKAITLVYEIKRHLDSMDDKAQIDVLKRFTKDEYVSNPDLNDLIPFYEQIGRITGTNIYFGVLDSKNKEREFQIMVNPDKTEVTRGIFTSPAYSLSFDLESQLEKLVKEVTKGIDLSIIMSDKIRQEEHGQKPKPKTTKQIINDIFNDERINERKI